MLYVLSATAENLSKTVYMIACIHVNPTTRK